MGSGVRYGTGRVLGGGARGIGVALGRQRPGSGGNGRVRSSWRMSRGGRKGGHGRRGRDLCARGPTRRNSCFFDLIKVISNGIALIQIKDGLLEI
jgi:hypothetical protein